MESVKVLLGFVSVVIPKAEWSCIKMANGEHYVVIFGGTIRREQKTFARSWVTLEELNTQLQEEVDQY